VKALSISPGMRLLAALAISVIAIPALSVPWAQAGDTIVFHDFEQGTVDELSHSEIALRPTFTSEQDEVLAGNRSLKADSTQSDKVWNYFLASPTGWFRPGEAYRIALDYRVLARETDAEFYLLCRSAGGGAQKDQAWKRWRGGPGDSGRIEVSFFNRAVADYYLILGIQGKGAIVIDNLTVKTDPAGRVPETRLPELQRTHESNGDTTYYVDSNNGDDANSGTNTNTPWKTLKRVNQTEFAPGDMILFRSGCTWQGVLAPGGSGTEDAPIVIDRYGEGSKPVIAATDLDLAAVYLHNVEYWEINNLEVVNRGTVPGARRIGVFVTLRDFGTAHHIHLKDLYVHDVNGTNVKGAHGGGIMWDNKTWGSDPENIKSRFDGLLIENCRLVRTDRQGIQGSGYWIREEWYPSLNVVIRGNLLEDIGGDAITPIGCDGALVEYNVVRGCGTRCRDAAGGIWPWSCDNTVVQFNEVSGSMAPHDGEAFDSDWNCRNSVFQYNYSHDNPGGFINICNLSTTVMPTSIGNVGTVIRYNISQNDGSEIFKICGLVKDTHIYNNTVYVGPDMDVHLIRNWNWEGRPEKVWFRNNIFYVDGKAGYFYDGNEEKHIFENNVFYGNHVEPPADPRAITADPMLVDPGSGGTGLDSLHGYALDDESPCIRAAMPLPNNGGRDFWGTPVPAKHSPDVGADQSPAKK